MNRPETGIDCQAAKKHPDLEIASQNQGAQQAGANELEISFIMDRYKKTGVLPELIKQDPTYGDFTNAPSFIEAHNIVNKAYEQFEALDAHIRTRFENDPAQFLEFVNDKGNLDEMRKMGLAKPAQTIPPGPEGLKQAATPPPPPEGGGKKE
jgi:phage internal scaffolding protein